MSAPSAGGFTTVLVSFMAAAGLVLLVPFAILVIGTPVALGVRVVLEVIDRVLPLIR